jgi:hypothetical protein
VLQAVEALVSGGGGCFKRQRRLLQIVAEVSSSGSYGCFKQRHWLLQATIVSSARGGGGCYKALRRLLQATVAAVSSYDSPAALCLVYFLFACCSLFM